MINFKKLFETVYEPRSGDEKNFKAKHIVAKYKTPYDTESQFTSNKSKAKRDADHDKGEDEQVYEAAELHTKRADKEPVIVRAVDPKTGQSKARTVLRRAGEIKIGEEVELEEGTVGHGKYTITTGPKMKGMGEGGPSHVVAKRAKMAKLGVPHHDEPGEYGHTVKVTVKNNETGETTHHHVYQRDTDKGSKEALVSTRSLGTSRPSHKAHEKVIHNYLSGKKVSSLKEESVVVNELGEKVANPYAIGMATAMKKAGDTPPLKKSTIVKGHEIAKSIMKKEAMDPVGKADADIDNDGDVDKSDKYLHARRKAIGKAIRKEEVELDEAERTKAYLGTVHTNDPDYEKKVKELKAKAPMGGTRVRGRSPKPEFKHLYKRGGKLYRSTSQDIKPEHSDRVDVYAKRMPYREAVEELGELDKKTLGSYVKKAAQSRGVAGIVAGGSAHKSKDQKDALKVMKNRMTGISRATDRLTKEEVDQLDELSPNTLHRYIKKATPEVAARAISAVAPNQSAETKKHASKLGKRIAGIASASGRLSDKANAMHEAAEYTMKQLQKKFDDGTHEAMNDPKPGYHVELRNTKTGKRTTHYVKEEVEMIDEAVKVGALSLHDGSSVNVTRAMADTLNAVFEQLTPANRAKMEQKLHTSKKDFNEILKFAESVNG